jgi:S-adenosylmethionine-diacylgycerolhomoserine-N-methlytransferase
MDRMYRRQRHIYDASRKFYLLGRDGMIADLAPPSGGTVLEIGCGTGRNLVKIARLYPHARCFGLDVSDEMLETARRSIARAGLEGRIRLAAADATCFDPKALFGVEKFDRVVISYALSMIPGWRSVLRGAAAHLDTAGQLHIVDFGDQHGLPAPFRSALKRWLAMFQVTPRADLADEVAALARMAGLSAACSRPFRGYAVRAVMQRAG